MRYEYERDRNYRVVVLTATKRPGGLDVCHNSIMRGGLMRDDVLWLIADDLWKSRRDAVREMSEVPTYHFDSDTWRRNDPSLYRTLALSFNEGLLLARKHGAELLVTMQDYVSIPDGGLASFLKLRDAHPDALLTGLCSHSVDPTTDEVTDLEGSWTIFEEPFKGRPEEIDWHDARDQGTGGYVRVDQVRWEANWGAVPGEILHNTNVIVDTAYDYGVAYENQGFAMACANAGYREVWCDEANHALALPHRKYFPWEEEQDEPHNNRLMHEAKWSW